MNDTGRPQTPAGAARPGTASGRPGSALRQPALAGPSVAGPVTSQSPQEPPAAAKEPMAARQMISSARPGLPLLPGARPASAGLKRPASAAGEWQACPA